MSNPDWSAWQFLIGDWVGEGTGEPGEGAGGFTFALELEQRILVRKNFAVYPATAERPAYRHDDLMLVYPQPDGTRAIYFDNEGHVLHYRVAFSANHHTLTFVSDAVPSEPRFRFTYERQDDAKLNIRFEIASPAQPDEFAPYIQARARRK